MGNDLPGFANLSYGALGLIIIMTVANIFRGRSWSSTGAEFNPCLRDIVCLYAKTSG